MKKIILSICFITTSFFVFSQSNKVVSSIERQKESSCYTGESLSRCLPVTAKISTPNGNVAIQDLKEGDPVYSTDKEGNKVIVPIQMKTEIRLDVMHEFVEITLADGRKLKASASHPDANGKALNELNQGDVLDGSAIVAKESIIVSDAITMDILPESLTKAYWADGVLVNSTITEFELETKLFEEEEKRKQDELVFDFADKEAEFPGGVTEMMKFISKNITYPDMAKEKEIQGNVYVQFVVKNDGSIADISIVKGLEEGEETGIHAEAIRVIKLMPKWTPGQVSGKNVNTKFVLPIRFMLR